MHDDYIPQVEVAEPHPLLIAALSFSPSNLCQDSGPAEEGGGQ